MSKDKKIKPIVSAIGATFAISLAASPIAQAENPFNITDHTAGFTIAGSDKGEGEGSCSDKGEGSCGDKGEGSCGDKGEGSCGDKPCDNDKKQAGKDDKERSCGEGKCS